MALIWKGPQAQAFVRKETGKRVQRAGKYLRDFLRRKLSVPNVGTSGSESKDG